MVTLFESWQDHRPFPFVRQILTMHGEEIWTENKKGDAKHKENESGENDNQKDKMTDRESRKESN